MVLLIRTNESLKKNVIICIKKIAMKLTSAKKIAMNFKKKK